MQVPEPAFELGLDFEVMPRYRGAGGGGAGCRDGTGKATCGTIDVAVRSPDGDAIVLSNTSISTVTGLSTAQCDLFAQFP